MRRKIDTDADLTPRSNQHLYLAVEHDYPTERQSVIKLGVEADEVATDKGIQAVMGTNDNCRLTDLGFRLIRERFTFKGKANCPGVIFPRLC